jgi:enoyl-CoA hydratase/carnithine racemase
VRDTKELLRRWSRARVLEAIDAEAAVFRERLSSPEASEAFTAFFQQRSPDFSAFS